MKIVIAEGGPAENVGSMALIENAIKISRMQFPDSEVVVLTPTVSSVEYALEKDGINGITVLEDLFVPPPSKSSTLSKISWLLGTLLWIILVRVVQFIGLTPSTISVGKRKKVLDQAQNADYILCIGAERINDVFYKTVFLSLEALRIYQRMGKKLIHLSLTIGPLFYKFSKKKASIVLDNSYAIFVRDQKSYQWLDELNVRKPKIFNSYDIAILQDKNQKNEVLKEFGLAKGFIGVSFIEWAFRKVDGPIRMEGYTAAVADTLDFIVDKYQLPVVFIPTVVNAKSYKVDDIEACSKVQNLMKYKEKVLIIDRLLSPGEMATLFSFCKFSIVTRMHAAILCSGAGEKPVISINYLYKLREFMKNMEVEDMSVDIDYVTSQKLIPLVESLDENYDEFVLKFNDRMKVLQNKLLADLSTCFNR
ncbi:MAG: polysaccharide pyruvyl transferase family protein [Dysgonamonadaceae bacterium]